MYIVTSKARRLKIDFDPEIYGLKKTVFGKEVPFKGVKFEDHCFTTDDEQLLHRMKSHPQYVEKPELACRDSFWVESTASTRELLTARGEVEITTDILELSVEDKDLLKYLDRFKDDIPMDRANLLNKLEEAIDRFGISSLRVPHIKSKDSRVSLVIHEVLDLLEESKIWPLPLEESIVGLEEELDPFSDDSVDLPEVFSKPEDKGSNEGKRSNARGKGRNSGS